MVETAEIERIARDVVNANTAPDAVIHVSSQGDLGWNGDPIVRISVVIKDEMSPSLSGEGSLNILTQLRDGLAANGEDRFPIIDYATLSESKELTDLAPDDDYPS